jgi:hypothetical protein
MTAGSATDIAHIVACAVHAVIVVIAGRRDALGRHGNRNRQQDN